jgi:hypothetical protein
VTFKVIRELRDRANSKCSYLLTLEMPFIPKHSDIFRDFAIFCGIPAIFYSIEYGN